MAVTAYWFHVAGQLRKGIDAFAAQRRAEGWVVEMAPVTLDGFPRAVTAHLNALALVDPAGPAWRADGVTVTIALFDPLNVVVAGPGFHRIALPGWSAILSAGQAQARIRLDTKGRPTTIALEAEALGLEQPGVDPLTLGRLGLAVDLLRPDPPGHQTASVAATLELRDLGLPDIPGLPLERRIALVQVEARLMGTPPDGPPLAALAAWSADGGTVELDRLVLDWAPLGLEGDGTLALDPRLQPLLATTVRIRGWGELLVRLVQAGLVEPGMAEGAKIMMAILARPDSQGRPTLTLPLAVQDGILTVGQVRVLQVPPLPIPASFSGGQVP